MRSAAEFPTIRTERLLLREALPEDAPAFRAVLSAPGVGRYSNWPDRPSSAEALRGVNWMRKLYPTGKGCAWMVDVGGRVAGAVRFNRIDKWHCGEIGYEIHPEFWGSGLMSEAVAGVVDCGVTQFKLNRIEAWTLPGNIASDRVLEKNGFRYEGTLRQRGYFKGGYHDFRMFGRIAGDFTAR